MSIFLGGGGATTMLRRRRDDVTNLRLPGPSPITPRDRIPREGPPHLDLTKCWSKIQKKCQKICFPKMSKIHFPGLRTLRQAIWTTHFRVFPIFLCKFSFFCGNNFRTNFPENLPASSLKAVISVR